MPVVLKYILFLSTIHLFLSCEQVVEPPDIFTPQLVVLSNFSPESELNPLGIIVKVSESVDILTVPPDSSMSGASVVLSTGNVVLDNFGIININGPLEYHYVPSNDDLNVSEGVRYTLTVARQGFPTVRAEEVVPRSIQLATFLCSEVTEGDALLLNGLIEYVYDITVQINDIDIFQDKFQIVPLFRAHDVFCGVSSLDTNLYLHTVTIPDNIPEAYVNFDDNSILFTEASLDENSSITFHCSIVLENCIDPLEETVVDLRTISDSYFEYYRTITAQSNVGTDIFAEPVFIFSNIENGIGIFGAYTSKIDTCNLNFE